MHGIVGVHIAAHTPPLSGDGRGRKGEGDTGRGARSRFEASEPGGTMIRP